MPKKNIGRVELAENRCHIWIQHAQNPLYKFFVVWANVDAINKLEKTRSLSDIARQAASKQQAVKSSFTLMIAIYTKKSAIFYHFSAIKSRRILKIFTPAISDMLFQNVSVLPSFREYLLYITVICMDKLLYR